MEKQKTSVFVAGKEYTVVSSDPPEYLRRVAAYADRKLKEIALKLHMSYSNCKLVHNKALMKLRQYLN